MSIKFVPSPTNPTKLDARYEIRQLTPEQWTWAAAIVCHSNIFHSPIWPIAYPDGKIERLHKMMDYTKYLVMHQINSGMSFGVFDTEYKFKRPESAATGGKLYWDSKDLNTNSSILLEQMDFPLCSVALAYDGINALDMSQMTPMIETLPLFATVYHQLEASDPRDPASWKATGPKEVLMRNATSTRADYEGQRVMKRLAQWLMRQAAETGFRGIQIECGHDAVSHVWLHPPKPFSADLVSTLDLGNYTEKDEQGETVHPFRECKQVMTKVYVNLVGCPQI